MRQRRENLHAGHGGHDGNGSQGHAQESWAESEHPDPAQGL